jgi:hypothetical protein
MITNLEAATYTSDRPHDRVPEALVPWGALPVFSTPWFTTQSITLPAKSPAAALGFDPRDSRPLVLLSRRRGDGDSGAGAGARLGDRHVGRRLTLVGRRLELSQFSQGEVDGREEALAATVLFKSDSEDQNSYDRTALLPPCSAGPALAAAGTAGRNRANAADKAKALRSGVVPSPTRNSRIATPWFCYPNRIEFTITRSAFSRHNGFCAAGSNAYLLPHYSARSVVTLSLNKSGRF